MAMTFNFNTFHSDSWTCSFSNLPSLSGVGDLAMYENFVKSFTLPDYNMEEMYSDFMAFRVRHQVAPKMNNNLSQVQVEFKLNEDMLNYFTLFEYMRQIKYADLPDTYSDMFRKYTIKSIMLNLMDNQKRSIATVRFTEAFLLSLSSLQLSTGTADEITFTANFSYEEILYEKKSIYYGGGDGTSC